MENRPIALSGIFVIPANSEVPFGFIGTSIRCIESTAAFRVSIDDDTSGMIFEKGIAYDVPDGEKFERFHLINPTGTPITCTIAMANGRVSDNRLVVGGGLSIAGGNLVNQGGQTGNTTAASTSATPNTPNTAISADANGTGWNFTNVGTDTIYLGTTSGVSAATGTPIAPGEKFSWDYRGNIYTVSATASQPYRILRSAN